MSTNELPARPRLKPEFPENLTPAQPLTAQLRHQAPLPRPVELVDIPLAPREPRYHVVIADDDAQALDAWQRSARAHYAQTLELRVWDPKPTPDRIDLLVQLQQWAAAGWSADVVVIDMNFDDGGRHGVHYLQTLRDAPGFVAMPVVMATGNQSSDLQRGALSSGQGENKTDESPALWLERLKPLEPEAVLYGKTGDARFLGRIGSGLAGWQRAARRRAWVALLAEMSKRLDSVNIDVDDIADRICEFAYRELGIEHAVVRRREASGAYKLIAARTRQAHSPLGDEVQVDEVPVLKNIVMDQATLREPVIRGRIGRDAAGKYADTLADMHFLGAAAVLGDRPVGFIAFLRPAAQPLFDAEVDGKHLTILARLFASAIRVSMLRDRQTRLLTFAVSASMATRRSQIAAQLANILHEEMHPHNGHASVRVRLTDYGTATLDDYARSSGTAKDIALSLRDGVPSVCANVLRSNRSHRIADTRRELDYRPSEQPMLSELCVPLNVGEFALGVVDLEHADGDFYGQSDQNFVEAAAALAASALERIRSDRLFKQMADFVLRFTGAKTTEELDANLRDLLFKFSGYAVLVELQAGAQTQAPWRVKGVHLPVQSGITDTDTLRNEIERVYATEWPRTLLGRLVLQEDWLQRSVVFTKNPNDFWQLRLTADGGSCQTADAVLWLRNHAPAPHRAILLMWNLPPPVGASDVDLLKTLADVFSHLYARRVQVERLLGEKVIGEQAAAIGHVLQHFKHRIGNLGGGRSVHLDSLEDAFSDGDAQAFARALERARLHAAELGNAFHRSFGYIKEPIFVSTPLQAVVDLATAELSARLARIALAVDIPPGLTAETDVDIASLVLYALVENALDATDRQEDAHIRISAEAVAGQVRVSVTDNGSGITAKAHEKLFSYGASTKPSGLGSALAFARQRAALLNGELDLAAEQPTRGARFELRLPQTPRGRR